MARDYKHRGHIKPVRPKARNPLQPVWLVVLVLALGSVLFYAFHDDSDSTDLAQTPANTAPLPATIVQQQPIIQKENPPEEKLIQFDFYTILPKKEVVVPEYEIKTRTREELVGQGKKTQYIMQASSYKTLKETEPLRAKLTAMGIESKIEKTKGGDVTWYRIAIGPYTQMTTIDALIERLRQKDIKVVVTEVEAKKE